MSYENDACFSAKYCLISMGIKDRMGGDERRGEGKVSRPAVQNVTTPLMQ